jgi:tRNA(Ile)-lysidine synthase
MKDKVLKYVTEHNMLEEGDLVVAGVSGGADSVCLLFMLIEISKVISIDIHVVHVNHMIRTDAADDAEYVRQLCINNNIPFRLVEKDVELIAKKLHISTEEAGRNIRYEAFYSELGDTRGKIAVAHNKNDCSETFLFNLFRGSSLKGLVGIRPVRDKVIRPLMCLERREIEEFLNEKKIKYCTDSTNLEDDYTRNKIRHHILDTAVNEISAGAVNNINNACIRISEAYDLIWDMTDKAFCECVTIQNGDKNGRNVYHIDEKKFENVHDTIKGYLIMEVLTRAAGKSKDLEAVHIRDIKNLMEKQCGREIMLPYGVRALRDYTGISVYKGGDECIGREITLSQTEINRLISGGEIRIDMENKDFLTFKLIDAGDKIQNLENIPQKKYTKWFDYDKIKGSVVIRTRKKGDYITFNGTNSRKTLKSYFIDEKIPKDKRNDIYLLANESHVIWVIGYRISSYYKICSGTRRILSVSYICGGDTNEGKEDCNG